MKSHTTTIGGKDLNFTRSDVLNIAKSQSIKSIAAAKIIDKAIEVVKNFENKAKEIGLDKKTIEECKEDIDSQISLLSHYS
jgi:hypothetical protein